MGYDPDVVQIAWITADTVWTKKLDLILRCLTQRQLQAGYER